MNLSIASVEKKMDLDKVKIALRNTIFIFQNSTFKYNYPS